ncbi:MAG TPA: PPC domain-containing protein [Candidatus Polarisedimenticolia bacterium]|jgi:hypothetical protein
MTRASSILRGVFGAALATLPWLMTAAPAEANWTATGSFVYVDREYDQTGFTGNQPQRAIRYADVHILDSKNKILASGATDVNGNYSLLVVDSSKRTVYARVTSRSQNTSTLFIDVQNKTGGNVQYYAVKTGNVSGHNPNTNVNFGTLAALIGQGGEAFNIFDQLVMGADYIASLTGSRPPSSDDLNAVWAINRGVADSSYEKYARNIQLRDSAGYDDTVILHEMGHFFVFEYSDSDSPDGSHTFSECGQDIRLSYEEGYSTYFGNSTLRYHNLPRSNIYMRSNGGPGPGNLVRYADLENDTQYLCRGDTSEVSVFTILWDITDSASTPDTTPGVDDAHDAMALPDSEVWQVLRDYIPTATSITFEDFWDGWFKAPISNGFLTQMRAIAGYVSVDFSEDAAEVNNSSATASPITVGGGPVAATFFYDQDGDGAGADDADYFFFSASDAQGYRVETTDLLSDANTYLEILDSDGATVLAFNDDRAVGDGSSLINWTAPRADVFFVRVTHSADWGIYGSYKVSVSPI